MEEIMNYMKTMKNIFKTVFILLLALGATGAMAQEEEKISNERITTAVETELIIRDDVPSYMIDVSTYEGVVTLTGSVPNILAKDRAAAIARTIKGVRAVVNEIDVRTPDVADDELKERVKEALLNDPATDSYEVDVEANDGVIDLFGKVESWHEKNLAEDVAKQVKGVTAVENNIAFEYTVSRPDPEIRKGVMRALDNSIMVDNSLIEVSVTNGVVDLDGIVGSAAEKYEAAVIAYTTGVENVDTADLKVRYWARNPNLRKDKYVEKPDEAIEEAVKDAFWYDPRVNSFDIKVIVEDAKVTLKGTVDNLKAKRAAKRTARNVVGVTMVTNLIKVRPEVPADVELINDVSHALLMDPYVERFEIDVDAVNGIVYLDGEVDSYFEKSQAEDITSRVYGVVDVKNYLNVRDAYTMQNRDYYYDYYNWNTTYPSDYGITLYSHPVSDDEIKASIENQLWWSPFINEDDIEITVDQGVATLSGEVETISEREMAVQNAYEGGASVVINNIEVY